MTHPALSKALILIKAGDSYLCNDPAIFPREADRKIAEKLVRLISAYEYRKSIDFERQTRGKSEAYAKALERKFAQPTALAEKRSEFFSALKKLETEDTVLSLLSEEQQYGIYEIRALLQQGT